MVWTQKSPRWVPEAFNYWVVWATTLLMYYSMRFGGIKVELADLGLCVG